MPLLEERGHGNGDLIEIRGPSRAATEMASPATTGLSNFIRARLADNEHEIK